MNVQQQATPRAKGANAKVEKAVVLLTTQGTMEVLPAQKPTYDVIQRLVSSPGQDDPIERVQVTDPRDGLRKTMWVNEEGHIHRLPINTLATRIYRNKRITNHYIVGHVVLVTGWSGLA